MDPATTKNDVTDFLHSLFCLFDGTLHICHKMYIKNHNVDRISKTIVSNMDFRHACYDVCVYIID